MSDSNSERNPVERLAEEFLVRHRQGERPTLTEYADRHPELADEIRDLFPALVMMEGVVPNGESTRTRDGGPGAPKGPPLTRLGDYRILREVGRGGMGVVYEAEQESLGRRVALKVLPPHALLDVLRLQRFQREARAAAILHHTNIVPVFGVGEADGLHFFAMQFIQGLGLDQVLDELHHLRHLTPAPASTLMVPDAVASVTRSLMTGQFELAIEGAPPAGAALSGEVHLPGASATTTMSRSGWEYWRSIARVGVQVADALAYAHSQGVLHRDVKPSNLLLDTHGTVWITDFGLAKAIDSDDGLTHTGDIIGTLRYMAPERFDGHSDARADVYALGVTLYELAALRPAFNESDRLRLVRQITDEEPARPRQINSAIPHDLETIVLKAMAKGADQRYQSAAALADDLRQFVADRPIKARRSGPLERLWRSARRNPGFASMVGAVALLLLLIAVGSSVSAWYLHTMLKESESNRIKAEAARAALDGQLRETEAAQRQARIELGHSLLAQGAAEQRSGLIGQRFKSLDLLGSAAGELRDRAIQAQWLPELRRHAIAARGLTDLHLRWERDVGAQYSAAFDAQLERCASVEYGTFQVVVRHVGDGRELFRLPRPSGSPWHAVPGFSPNGRYLLVFYFLNGEFGELHVWDLNRHELVFQQRVHSVSSIFHPNGRWLLYCPAGRGVAIWDLVARRQVKRLPLDGMLALCLDTAGRRLAAAQEGGHLLRIVEIDSGREVARWTSQVGERALAWSADGRLLVSASGSRAFVWDVPHGKLVSVLRGHTGLILNSWFVGPGYLLATTSWDNTTRLWDAATGDCLVKAPGVMNSVSADGRWIGFHDSTKLGVWDMAPGLAGRALHPMLFGNQMETSDWVAAADFSPDGRLLALASANGVRLYATDTGIELAHLETGKCITVLFHSDGESLVTSGDRGLFQWPIRPGRAPNSLQVGPPQFLQDLPDYPKAAWLRPDYRSLAVLDRLNTSVRLVDLDRRNPGRRPSVRLRNGYRNMTSVAISPDGRWAAAGGHKIPGVLVWDVLRHRQERLLPPADGPGDVSTDVSFSPNGRWLVVAASEDSGKPGYSFWHVGTWDRGLFIPYEKTTNKLAPVFTRNGRLMAMSVSLREIVLADAATGREITRLTTLQPLGPAPLAFSPDGSKLVANTNQGTALLWDLRAIRAKLVAMNLDWDEPAIPPAKAASAPPMSVRVIGTVPLPAVRRQRADADLTIRLALSPFDAEAHYRDGLRLRQAKAPERALAAFGLAIDLGLKNPDVFWQRGWLHYQKQRWAAARADFCRCLALDPNHLDALHFRGHAHDYLGNYPAAIADFTAALRLEPRDPHFFVSRGWAYSGRGSYRRAIADFQAALKLNPNEAFALEELVWLYVLGPLDLRDLDRAERLVRQLVQLAPTRLSGRFLTGVIAVRRGRWKEAVIALKRDIKLRNGLSTMYYDYFLAICHNRLGDPALARECFRRGDRWFARNHARLTVRQRHEMRDLRADAATVLGVKAEPLK